MSTEENKALVRRFHEAFNKEALAAFDQYGAPDLVDHGLPPGVPPTIEGTKMFLSLFLKGFPDIHVEADDLVAEGDKVAARSHFTGTHTGDFQGLPPTGKHVKVDSFDMFRIAGDKIVEHWGVVDAAGMMQQLGAVPPPAQGGS